MGQHRERGMGATSTPTDSQTNTQGEQKRENTGMERNMSLAATDSLSQP